MRFITTLILCTALALPAMAAQKAKPHHAMRQSAGMTPRETVNDKGPFTPEANRAYNGGGMITESAPGTAPMTPMAPMSPMR